MNSKNLIRYDDLVSRGIVASRMTLKRLIDRHGFPAGICITPNARAWRESDVDEWIASRPTARKPPTYDGHSAKEVAA